MEDREDCQNVLSSLHLLETCLCENSFSLQTESEGRTLIGCYNMENGEVRFAVSGKKIVERSSHTMTILFCRQIGKRFYTCTTRTVACSYASS